MNVMFTAALQQLQCMRVMPTIIRSRGVIIISSIWIYIYNNNIRFMALSPRQQGGLEQGTVH